MPAKVTLQQLAQRLGIGKATVSRALRNQPKVAEGTRELVRKAAHELGYRRDPAIANMAHYRWPDRQGSNPVVVAAVAGKRYEGAFARSRFGGAREAASHLGYRIDEFFFGDYPDPMRLRSVLANRGIRGLLVGPLHGTAVPAAFWRGFTAVLYGQAWQKPPLHEVLPDHFSAVRRVISVVASRGYRNLGLLLDSPLSADDNDLRLGAFLAELSRPGVESRGHLLQLSGDSAAKLGPWIKRCKLDLVLGLRPEILQLIQAAGFAVPEEVGFVSLNLPAEGGCAGSPAGLDLLPAEVGKTAVALLDSLLRENERGVPQPRRRVLVEPRWVEGPTIRSAAV